MNPGLQRWTVRRPRKFGAYILINSLLVDLNCHHNHGNESENTSTVEVWLSRNVERTT